LGWPSASEVEHLPSNCEALSSNSSTTKKEKKGKINMICLFSVSILIANAMMHIGAQHNGSDLGEGDIK
jgi:hypothetical protein